MRTAIEGGMADAWAEFDTLKKDKVDAGEVGAAQFFGTPADLKGNYLYRMAGAVLGIYGNTAAEALYPSFANDSAGEPLTGANNYTYRFAKDQLPPVNAFWSLTMYELPQSLLVANPINRYLINSPMLPSLVPDTDGGYTVSIQNESPGQGKECELAARTEGPVRAGAAAVLAEAGRAQRHVEGAETRKGLAESLRRHADNHHWPGLSPRSSRIGEFDRCWDSVLHRGRAADDEITH